MALESTNPVVRNALNATQARNDGWDVIGAAAWLAGAAASEAVTRKREEAKRRAQGGVAHAVRDLRGSLPFFDMLAKTGGGADDAAARAVRDSVAALSRMFGV